MSYPWEVRISDQTIIVTELDGTIAMIGPNGTLTRHRVQTSDLVVRNGGSGPMGLALADDFADTGTAYVYYTYDPGTGLTNRTAELAFDGNAWDRATCTSRPHPGPRALQRRPPGRRSRWPPLRHDRMAARQ
ncbi:PQQ-dependent sugar dehydrogenase [Micromonospora sp. NPDC049460]|uniref:PQQ-dependent sugar dehydrogenase n=1 Tax=Micromonospora sp. NPDC049460 TaxID=3364272 RepID=UPI0037985F16